MTKAETIEELSRCYLVQSDDEGRRRNQALNIAIEAIKYAEWANVVLRAERN